MTTVENSSPEHRCATIEEAGHCPICRARALEVIGDGCHGWFLDFYDEGESQGAALVRSWAPGLESAVEAAWATGCNPGGAVYFAELPVEAIERSELPVFTLLGGTCATQARDLAHSLHPHNNKEN